MLGVVNSAIFSIIKATVGINNDLTKELNVVDSTLYNRVFDASTSEYMKNIILPNKSTNSLVDHAYGVFLGYSLDLDSTTLSNQQFRTEVVNKMKNDIRTSTPYILNKINSMGLSGYSFYFYVLPFNDASKDQKNIFSSLLAGG